MVNKSANDTDRSSTGGGAAASLELDVETDETQVPPPDENVIGGCPDPKNCTDPSVTVDSGLDNQAAA